MAEPDHLEAVARAMFTSHQGVRLGAYFFGLIITICLQTLAVSQFTKWCMTSWKSERVWYRFLTVYMIVSGMGFTVTQCVRCFDVFVANYGEYGSLLSQAIPRFLTVFMSTAHLGSEAFYIHRAYVLSGRSRTLVIAFGIFWFALLVVSGVAIAKIPPLLTDYGALQFALFTAQGALLMVVDVSITLLTIYFLYRRRDEQSGTPANSLIHRLIRVETQLPVSIVAIISTTLLASGCVWFSPVCTALICGLSQVTLFKVLNSRRNIREREGLVTTAGPNPPTTQRIRNDYGVPYLDYKAPSSSGSDRVSDDKPLADDNLYFGSRPQTI